MAINFIPYTIWKRFHCMNYCAKLSNIFRCKDLTITYFYFYIITFYLDEKVGDISTFRLSVHLLHVIQKFSVCPLRDGQLIE